MTGFLSTSGEEPPAVDQRSHDRSGPCRLARSQQGGGAGGTRIPPPFAKAFRSAPIPTQGTLHEDVKLFIAEQQASNFKDAAVSRFETVDGDHGRIETRRYIAIHDVEWLRERHGRPGLKGVVMVESQREIDGATTRQTRFYITFRPSRPTRSAR